MDMTQLVRGFRDCDLSALDPVRDFVSSRTPDGRFFPPYAPLVGVDYHRHGVLVYATAQNIGHGDDVASDYSTHFDGLVERLWYSRDFSRKYPEDCIDYSEVLIAPYQGGVLPALAGVFLHALSLATLERLADVQDHIAVSNYHKFSLHRPGMRRGGDIHPDKLGSYVLKPAAKGYWDLNDALASMELDFMVPTHVLTFRGRQARTLDGLQEQYALSTWAVNDPSWILRGHGGCCSEGGSWWRKAQEVDDDRVRDLVSGYVDGLQGPYAGHRDAVEVYLLKYYADWCNELA